MGSEFSWLSNQNKITCYCLKATGLSLSVSRMQNKKTLNNKLLPQCLILARLLWIEGFWGVGELDTGFELRILHINAKQMLYNWGIFPTSTHSLVVGIEPRTSYIIGKHFTTELYSQIFSVFYFVVWDRASQSCPGTINLLRFCFLFVCFALR